MNKAEIKPVPVRTFEGHEYTVECIAWYPDGCKIVSGSADGELRIWETQTGLQVGRAVGVGFWGVWALDVSSDGTTIASGSADGTVRLWDSETAELIHTCEGHEDWVKDVHFSSNSKRVASGSQDRTLRIWDVDTGEFACEPVKCKGWVKAVRYSPDGDRVASGGTNVQIWDAVSDSLVLRVTLEEDVNSLAWTHDGDQLVAGGSLGTVAIWNVSSREQTHFWKVHKKWVQLSLSPTTTHLATCNWNAVVLDIDTGEQITEYEHDTSVNYVAYSPSGNLIATACGDDKVYLWEAPQKSRSPGSSILDLPAVIGPGDARVCDQVIEQLLHDSVLDVRSYMVQSSKLHLPAIAGPSPLQPTNHTAKLHGRTLRGTIDGIFRPRSKSRQDDNYPLGPNAHNQPTRGSRRLLSRSHLLFPFRSRNSFRNASRGRNSTPDENQGDQEARTPEGNWVAESRTRPIMTFRTDTLPDEVEHGCFFHLASYICYGQRDPNVISPTFVTSPAPGASPLVSEGTTTSSSGSHTYPPAPATTTAPTVAQASASPMSARIRALFSQPFTFLGSRLHPSISSSVSAPSVTTASPVVPTVIVTSSSSRSAKEPTGTTDARQAFSPLPLSTSPNIPSSSYLPSALDVMPIVSTLPLSTTGKIVESIPEVRRNDVTNFQSPSGQPLAVATDASMLPAATRTLDYPSQPVTSTTQPPSHDPTLISVSSPTVNSQCLSQSINTTSGPLAFDEVASLEEYLRQKKNIGIPAIGSSPSSQPLST